MALVLLVIGALMSGAGIYAVIYGYSIIHVEEGWASVISGATLIAGGMVTIALGLVLRTLKQVKAGLLEAPARATTPADPSSAIAADPAPSLPLDMPAAEPAPVAAEASQISMAPFAPEPAFGSPVADYGAAAPVASPSRFEVDAGEAAKLSDDMRLRPSVSAPSPSPPPPPPPPVVETPRPADDYKLETPSTAEHDLPPARAPDPTPVAAEPASPPMDDWLDRAFAELDRDNPPLPPAKPQTAAEPAAGGAPTPAQAKPVFPPRPSPGTSAKTAPSPEPEKAPRDSTANSRAARSETSALEAAVAVPAAQSESARQATQDARPDAAPAPQQAAPATQSAVIGRYESDGTTYVMFADGSIEAQSASGVYRFASMAELKAYIES